MAVKTTHNIELLGQHHTVKAACHQALSTCIAARWANRSLNRLLAISIFFQNTRHSSTEMRLKKKVPGNNISPYPTHYITYSVIVAPRANRLPPTSTHSGFQVGKGYREFVTSIHLKRLLKNTCKSRFILM